MLKLRQVHNHERHCGVRRDRSSDKICRALTTGPGAGAGKCRVMIRAQPRGGTDNIARSPLMRAPERVGDESGRSSRQADRRTAVHFRNAADDRQCGIRCNRHADLICSHGGIPVATGGVVGVVAGVVVGGVVVGAAGVVWLAASSFSAAVSSPVPHAERVAAIAVSMVADRKSRRVRSRDSPSTRTGRARVPLQHSPGEDDSVLSLISAHCLRVSGR